MLRVCMVCKKIIGCYIEINGKQKKYDCNDKTNCTPTQTCSLLKNVSHGVCESCLEKRIKERINGLESDISTGQHIES